MKPKMLVFAVGALNLVAGASLGFAFGRSTAEGGGFRLTPCEAVQDAVHDPQLPHLADGLGLEPEKAAKVSAILASCGPRFEAVMDETRPRLQALHEKLQGELSAVLTPEQMDRLRDEYRKRYGSLPHAH